MIGTQPLSSQIDPEANQLDKRYYYVFARIQDYLDYAL